MRKTIFFTDLDNTLLYSYKHEIGDWKKCVEIYQGREISFMTERTLGLLKEILRKVMIVPTTTRTVEQYRRIQLGIGTIPYALVCNGGVLLADGAEDSQWYKESLELTAQSRPELGKAEMLLAEDSNRIFEVRMIKDLFVFTKSSRPDATVKKLTECLDTSVVEPFCNGVKVYAVPVGLNKGIALKRLAARLGAEKTIAAGDSKFDIPMLECADYAFAPEKLAECMAADCGVVKVKADETFSDSMLEYVVQVLRKL